MDLTPRARPASPHRRGEDPIVLWHDLPVEFPLRRELVLDASEAGAAPRAIVLDDGDRALVTFAASLEDVIGGHAESAVLAEADAFIERLTRLRDRSRPALATASTSRRRKLTLVLAALALIVALLAYDGAEDRRQAAYTRDLEQALSSVIQAQESFHARFDRYAGTLEELRISLRLEPWPPGTVVTIGRTSPAGYTATAAHPRSRSVCTVERSPHTTIQRCE